MNTISRAGRAYWQANERIWNSIETLVDRSPWPFFAALLVAFVAVSITLNENGHGQAAFVVNMVMAVVGPPTGIYLARARR